MAVCIIQAVIAASVLDPPASEPNEGKRGEINDASSELASKYEVLIQVQLVDVAAPSGPPRTQGGDAQESCRPRAVADKSLPRIALPLDH